MNLVTRNQFKLSMRQIHVGAPGGMLQRALVIAVAPVPGMPGWLRSMLACEDGSMQEKIISTAQFEESAGRVVTLLECEGERAAPVIYTPTRG